MKLPEFCQNGRHFRVKLAKKVRRNFRGQFLLKKCLNDAIFDGFYLVKSWSFKN